MVPLSELGDRICILGPSNSGKSTLAEAISRKRTLPAVHLDRLYHHPHSDWEPRPLDEFVALHDAAIGTERWVMDGNYSRCFPQRFQRATGIILLDVSTGTSLMRYLLRTRSGTARAGGLDGDIDSIKLAMLHHIVVVTPANRRRYAAAVRAVDLPVVVLPSVRAAARAYAAWGLEAPVKQRPGQR